jgi:Ca2+-binding RTX toxin-like protein
VGGDDNDSLVGGAGDDTLVGGIGAAAVTGGNGKNIFFWNPSGEVRYTITNFVAKADQLLFSAAGPSCSSPLQVLSLRLFLESSDGTHRTAVACELQ